MTLYIDTRPTLEWVWNATKKRHEAKTPFGTYTIDEGVGGFIIYFEDVWCIERDYSHDAMAAAQADYEARTAERFRKVEVPSKRKYQDHDSPDVDVHIHGYNTAIDALMEAIAKAKE
jgi:hypothetical protein